MGDRPVLLLGLRKLLLGPESLVALNSTHIPSATRPYASFLPRGMPPRRLVKFRAPSVRVASNTVASVAVGGEFDSIPRGGQVPVATGFTYRHLDWLRLVGCQVERRGSGVRMGMMGAERKFRNLLE